jgi:endo-1,4-beta-D-glucanase Y
MSGEQGKRGSGNYRVNSDWGYYNGKPLNDGYRNVFGGTSVRVVYHCGYKFESKEEAEDMIKHLQKSVKELKMWVEVYIEGEGFEPV